MLERLRATLDRHRVTLTRVKRVAEAAKLHRQAVGWILVAVCLLLAEISGADIAAAVIGTVLGALL